jgi:predicted GIY-YIG superfamily endonuclease
MASRASERASPSPSNLETCSTTMTSSSSMRWVYILRCADNSLYIGETDDLVLRVARHNEGRGCVFTARRRPVTLVYSEVLANREDAMKRERQLKRWTRAKKEALIVGDVTELKRL